MRGDELTVLMGKKEMGGGGAETGWETVLHLGG